MYLTVFTGFHAACAMAGQLGSPTHVMASLPIELGWFGRYGTVSDPSVLMRFNPTHDEMHSDRQGRHQTGGQQDRGRYGEDGRGHGARGKVRIGDRRGQERTRQEW